MPIEKDLPDQGKFLPKVECSVYWTRVVGEISDDSTVRIDRKNKQDWDYVEKVDPTDPGNPLSGTDQVISNLPRQGWALLWSEVLTSN